MTPFHGGWLMRPRRLLVVMALLYLASMFQLVRQVRIGLAEITPLDVVPDHAPRDHTVRVPKQGMIRLHYNSTNGDWKSDKQNTVRFINEFGSHATVNETARAVLREELAVLGYDFDKCSGSLNYTSLPVPPSVDWWQTVQAKHLYVYSAFLDQRHNSYDFVKVNAIHAVWERPSGSCQLWFEDEISPLVIDATIVKYPEQAKVNYAAAVIRCKLKKLPTGIVPKIVSIVTKSCDQPNNSLSVRDNRYTPEPRPLFNYTVCLGGPLKFGLNNSFQLSEWLELNSMFGANHFILYNHSASTLLTPHVQYYVTERKLIEWLPWQLPESIENPRQMKNFGHTALVNDCLYRSMYLSKRVVFIDTDEFIVPRFDGVKTWDGLLARTKCAGATFVSIQNVFFKKEWPDDDVITKADARVKQLDLVTQLKTKREQKVWRHGSRSKYMVDPEKVDVAGIHKPWRMSGSGITRCKLHPNAALMHHYRWWDDPTPDWVEDKWLHKYTEDLVRSVERTHEQVKHLFNSQLHDNI